MGKPKKYDGYDIYAPQRAYFKTEKGKAAVKRYNATESAKQIKREWYRKNRSVIVDKKQWFIDTYGDTQVALAQLEEKERYAIELYYGLSGNEPLTLNEIAQVYGKSESLICKLKKSALKKLKSFQQTSNLS